MAKLSRQESKARTRQALLDAILDVLTTDGLEGLTTTKVARRAGAAQSSFYVHFESMDQAVETLAADAAARMREAVEAERKNMTIDNPLGAIRAQYRASLNALLATPELSDLMLRYRRAPNHLGETFRHLEELSKESMERDLAALGITEETLPHLSIYLDMVIRLNQRALEGLIEGEYDDIEDCLDVLENVTANVLMNAVMRGGRK